MAQQFDLAAELQVAHVTGEELYSHMREGVGDGGGAVWKRGAAHPADTQFRQVGLAMSPDGSWVGWKRHLAGFT